MLLPIHQVRELRRDLLRDGEGFIDLLVDNRALVAVRRLLTIFSPEGLIGGRVAPSERIVN
jgi:hypothetical protein